ncbi:CoA pyrophosphatase [uncultured Enterovirga sp.]|uniref:CoA pyrophosphatase n=1 Tax=uncultured Enterovirga sp. TaxID=2026352 RepID=UPI0035CB85F5
MIAETIAPASVFEARALARLRREPPGFLERRADLKGDHALDPESWPDLDEGIQPRVAAVLVPVVAHPTGASILLTERAANMRQHSGQIAFPGGKMDPEDATPLATALREAEEEIGLDQRHVRPLGYLDAYLSGTNFFVVPAVAMVEPGFHLRINPHEVACAFEVPLDFLMDERHHELHAREWKGRIRTYYAMPFEGRYIWGVTAGILRNMHERLYGDGA